jgi:hypothetical protein
MGIVWANSELAEDTVGLDHEADFQQFVEAGIAHRECDG